MRIVLHWRLTYLNKWRNEEENLVSWYLNLLQATHDIMEYLKWAQRIIHVISFTLQRRICSEDSKEFRGFSLAIGPIIECWQYKPHFCKCCLPTKMDLSDSHLSYLSSYFYLFLILLTKGYQEIGHNLIIFPKFNQDS